ERFRSWYQRRSNWSDEMFQLRENLFFTLVKSNMQALTRKLESSKFLFITWSMVAAFGAYFCVYAFRKPFNAGTYSGLEWMGMNYKAVLIIAQVLGYMLSKFIGIKVISELTAS